MRLLQLDIRRKLYQAKRPTPKNDRDPWFKEMEEKLIAWRDASPNMDGGSGLDQVWFIGRYNTMIIFLFRPSPQVPKPSVRAAKLCYDACEYNIHMTRKQIEAKNVDLTWIFTQAIFMAINHVLWSISYEEVRRLHPREEVERNLRVALESIGLASERWPGVESALELYQNLIAACIRCYDRDGDIAVPIGSPPAEPPSYIDGLNGSRHTSPATVSSVSIKTPLEKPAVPHAFIAPYPPNLSKAPQHLPTSRPAPSTPSPPIVTSSPFQTPISNHSPSHSMTIPKQQLNSENMPFDPGSAFNPLPTNFGDTISWNPIFTMPSDTDMFAAPTISAMQGLTMNNSLRYDASMADVTGGGGGSLAPPGPHDYMGFPTSMFDRRGGRLSMVQHMELMQELQTQGMGQIENMIEQSSVMFGRPQQVPGT
jgi:hypothetical protein